MLCLVAYIGYKGDLNKMELLNGRPDNTSGRLEKEIRTYDYLDNLGIEYQRVDHEPAETMEACKAVDEVLGIEMCKNLMLCNKQKTNFYMLLMPADKKFKTKELSSQINSARLSFAGGEEMEKYLDIVPGSLSVMGLMNDHNNDVRLLIDEDTLNAEYIGCHPCVNTSSLKIKMDDIVNTYLPATGHTYTSVHLVGED